MGAAELAAALAAHEARVAHIVSSPYVRCVETADAVASRLGVPILIEPGIGEVGCAAHTLLSTDELGARFAHIDTAYVPCVARSDIPAEHSDGQAARRAHAAALAVRKRLRGPILLVGHGASCLGLVQAFGGSGYVGYTSLSHFARDADVGRWALRGEQGDVSHLSDKETARASAW